MNPTTIVDDSKNTQDLIPEITEIKRVIKERFDYELDETYEEVSVKIAFHTWVAINGTEIFHEGIKFKSQTFDYVNKIKRNAEFFNSQGIPLMIVYSYLKLTEERIKKMHDFFEDSDNIVLLCLERDLQDSIPYESYGNSRWYLPCELSFMDKLRVMVANDADKVIAKAEIVAEKLGKQTFLKNLRSNPGNAIMYNDIDITWNHKVPTVLAKNGMYTSPSLSTRFTFDIECTYNQFNPIFTPEEVETMKEINRNLIDPENCENREQFRKDKLKYVLYSDVFEKVKELYTKMGTSIPNIATGENNMFATKISRGKEFGCKAFKFLVIIDLHPFEDMKAIKTEKDPFAGVNHFLVYTQLVQFMYTSNDRSWIVCPTN
ncbi:hypothetical protein [Carp edema virus]|nr:hypothetical protein [Carp edema virus]